MPLSGQYKSSISAVSHLRLFCMPMPGLMNKLARDGIFTCSILNEYLRNLISGSNRIAKALTRAYLHFVYMHFSGWGMSLQDFRLEFLVCLFQGNTSLHVQGLVSLPFFFPYYT